MNRFDIHPSISPSAISAQLATKRTESIVIIIITKYLGLLACVFVQSYPLVPKDFWKAQNEFVLSQPWKVHFLLKFAIFQLVWILLTTDVD